VDAFGGIDILVNNAGINIRKRPEDLEPDEWQQVLNTNLTSAYLCSRACYPALKRAGGGKILNNGSMLSIFGTPWGPAYAASKGGMVQLTKSLATAWAADNIQVNCFLPGWIDTELTVNARREVEGLHDRVLARTPAGRWGDVEDFEGLAIFFASPASNFITGVAIPVDGGFSVSG
jgi:2-deoxy-D-gluconate 3-dehydrogenase